MGPCHVSQEFCNHVVGDAKSNAVAAFRCRTMRALKKKKEIQAKYVTKESPSRLTFALERGPVCRSEDVRRGVGPEGRIVCGVRLDSSSPGHSGTSDTGA